MKLYKGLECPLDGYEIVLFSLSGPDGKMYPLCPYCYNNPPFEGAHKVSSCLSVLPQPYKGYSRLSGCTPSVYCLACRTSRDKCSDLCRCISITSAAICS